MLKELEDLGILDEKNPEIFLKALEDSGIEENLYRYVIAYTMHQNGLDADYIAASSGIPVLAERSGAHRHVAY